ncbi:hypothetical protein [Geodermatophilus obscurus]|uniref:hypothetical protein n=1 Tax=Geodermatophilus obscurus TaxID=1861 RepID=UPI0009448AF9|nr:hypothetical protein [Geodermatophilus obscurus]
MTDWIALLLSGLALIASGIALVYSRRATRAAEVSATAAERSAAVAERGELREQEAAEERAVRWQLTHDSVPGDANLTNRGERAAHDVKVDLESEGGQRRHLNAAEIVEVGDHAVERLAMGSLGRQQVLTVRWRTSPDGPERTSRQALYLWWR